MMMMMTAVVVVMVMISADQSAPLCDPSDGETIEEMG